MGKNYETVEKKFSGNIVLIGFMGTGKSSIARKMSKLFGLEIIEMDETIEEREGISITEMFGRYGEEYFRNLETDMLIEMQSMDNVIVSCGGGTPLRQCNVDEMKKIGTVVLLSATPDTILSRVERSHNRPLLENNKTTEFISEMLGKRRDKYQAAADIIIETDGKSKFEICKEINERLASI